MKRKNFESKFKSKVAIEAIKGRKTINELSTTFGVHAAQINTWRKLLLEGSEDIFSKGLVQNNLTFSLSYSWKISRICKNMLSYLIPYPKGRKKQTENHEEEKDKLYTQIVRLKVEVDWLKKRRDIWIVRTGQNCQSGAAA